MTVHELPKGTGMRSRAGKLIAAASLAIALSGSALVESAHAKETGSDRAISVQAEAAYNYKVQYLTEFPKWSMGSSFVSRRIFLKEGYYSWNHLYGNRWSSGRTIHLGEGWYTWTDVFSPENGYYDHRSVLNPDRAGWEDAVIDTTWNPLRAGDYAWGSRLGPQF